MPSAVTDPSRPRPEPYFTSAHGSVYYTPRSTIDRRRRGNAPPTLPTPPIQPRQRRPHSIHIVSYPAGFIPYDLRQKPLPAPKQPSKRQHKKKQQQAQKEAEEKEKRDKAAKRRSILSLPPIAEKQKGKLGKLLSVFSITPKSPTASTSSSPPTPAPSPRSRTSSFASFARRLSLFEFDSPALAEPGIRPTSMVDTIRPGSVVVPVNGSYRNSILSMRSGKMTANSSVVEVPKPVATGSGVACSIILAEPNVFLTGFDHDGHPRHESHNSTALLRGKLHLDVSKSVKIKSVTLKLLGKARTEWPEGIPPLKVDMSEEETLRTQSLVFFHAMHEDMWETEYGNQCRFNLKAVSGADSLLSAASANQSSTSIRALGGKPRQPTNLTAKELKRLSIQSVNSRSFGKGESPLANQTQAKGYKIFQPGTYEYSFELPIDHHQLETTKLQYGSVKWELETTVERAGAFKANLHGSKEVTIVRVPDQMSLEMSEPISISRQWEDQLHYDIMISGKSFPIGAKIPIAFKLTPLAKVQVHKLKVFVTESIEYWTNDRRVTRKDPGRKILLLEKTAGKPLDKQYAASDIRVLSGGELAPEERVEARRAAESRRSLQAARVHGVAEPLPEPTENILGDLDLGLEHYWGSTEMEMNVQIPTCEMMAKDKSLRLHPDCSWKNVNVYHWIKIVMRISRLDPDDPNGKRRRHFEISIDSPFTVLNCRATRANTALPQYCGADGPDNAPRQSASCGCPDASVFTANPSSSNGHLAMVEQDITPMGGAPPLDRVSSSVLPVAPRSAHINTSNGHPSRQNSSASTRLLQQRAPVAAPAPPRPMHLMRVPSYNPPAFDAEDPPPPIASDILTPPPKYDIIIGTPSVDGMADYFARLNEYELLGDNLADLIRQDPPAVMLRDSGISVGGGEAVVSGANGPGPTSSGDDFFTSRAIGAPAEDETDSDENDDPARPHQRGRVNVANPRTPGGRLVPSRSLEIERPAIPLSMAGVTRREE
ncbi:hypothetical protein GQ53DRAFT_363005 [Thozetella sp. PMI_491]|nr:hypothetical protein GQ53DRAFT_363005 [Thozetella sp. PMI_491]